MKGLERHRIWLILALALMFIAGAYYVGVKGEKRSAFNRWRPNVQELMQGDDIYLKRNFPTPPIMALILLPFTMFSAKVGMTAWFAFKACLTLIAVWMMIDVVERSRLTSLVTFHALSATKNDSPPLTPWFMAIAFAFSARPVLGDLLHGNINLWILFLVSASIWCFATRRDFACGLIVALATACKLTPVLLGAYFLWKRSWRVSIAFCLGLVLWFVLVPGLCLGFARNTELLKNWTHTMVVPYVAKHRLSAQTANQSLAGLLARLFAESENGEDESPTNVEVEAPTKSAASDDWSRGTFSIELTDVQVSMLIKGVIAFCFIGLAVACRAPSENRRDARLYHEISLVLIAMLLVSERSWKHHFVTLLPSYFLLIRAAVIAADSPGTRRRGSSIWLLLIASQVFIALTSQDLAKPFFGKAGALWFQSMGAFTWSALLLAVGHVVATRPIKRIGAIEDCSESNEERITFVVPANAAST